LQLRSVLTVHSKALESRTVSSPHGVLWQLSDE